MKKVWHQAEKARTAPVWSGSFPGFPPDVYQLWADGNDNERLLFFLLKKVFDPFSAQFQPKKVAKGKTLCINKHALSFHNEE
jgi:hypothetical protein